jgi:hypothetical protein
VPAEKEERPDNFNGWNEQLLFVQVENEIEPTAPKNMAATWYGI